jgi:hypothetical protein
VYQGKKAKRLVAMILSLTGLLSGLVPFGFARAGAESSFRVATKAANSHHQVEASPLSGDNRDQSALVSSATEQKEVAREAYGKLPLLFEANDGQVSKQVKFLSRGQNYNLFLTPSEAVLTLRGERRGTGSDRESRETSAHAAPSSFAKNVLRMRLMGANKNPEMMGMDEAASKVNYFIGNDSARWHPNVATYAKVRYQEIYPGIDLLYYGNQQQLEYDFVLAPGADYRKIRLAFEGARALKVDVRGDLVLQSGPGAGVRQAKPIAYQEVDGARREVESRYFIEEKNRVGFQLGAYDPARPLVIDPVLSYSTLLGGNSSELADSIAVDAAGNAYVVGATFSPNFPIANAFQSTGRTFSTNPIQDVFVTKINAAGSALVFSTYLGGIGDDLGHGIAVDPSGNVYLTGETGSGDFPVANAVMPTSGAGRKAFVTKMNATGSTLIYSTYLGGNGAVVNIGSAIAVDSSGNAYVTGRTNATNFPTANALQPTLASPAENCGFFGCSFTSDAFVTKFDAAGSFVFSTFLGGRSEEGGSGITVDSSGNVYVTGVTSSTNFPTTPGSFQTTNPGNYAFVTKLNAAGNGLVYSTYFGSVVQASAIAVDASGNAYVIGTTVSSAFPTTAGAFDRQCGTDGTCNRVPNGPTFDAFIFKLNAAGSDLLYSTYLGGSGPEYGLGVAVDASGNAFVAGSTSSSDFPVANSLQAFGGGDCGFNGQSNPCTDAFVTKLNTTGSALVYSTFLGGSGNDLAGNLSNFSGNPIAVDNSGNAYVTGSARLNFPTTASAFQPASGGGDCGGTPCSDAFITKISDPGSWQPVVLTAQQLVEIKAWTVGGRTYVYVKPQFPDAGYRVVNWVQAIRSGNDFTADASVEKFSGPSIQAVVTTAQIYDLGPLANGTYNFNFKTSGTLAKTLQFSISSTVPPPNPIDDARQFVKQQYRDFLNREADQAGEDFWTDNITKCNDPARRPPGQTVEQCTLRQRETTSGAFFLSPEFQYTGYFVYRMYQGALGRQPKLSEFIPDAQFVGNGTVVNGQLSGALINQNKAAFAAQFVNCTDATKYRCAEFKAIYDGLNNQQYVDKLFLTTGVNASAADRTALVNGLNGGTETRATVLQKVVDGINVISEGNQQFTTTYGQAFYNAEFNRAFVLLEYFGYMKRDPDDAGYAFWLGKLNQFGGNFVNAEMVLAFISSPEHRARFGQP